MSAAVAAEMSNPRRSGGAGVFREGLHRKCARDLSRQGTSCGGEK